MAAILSAEAVTVRFGGITALKDVSFEVKQGEFLSLIGPNGAGKTTLLKTITGIVKPANASIKINDREITKLPTHSRIRLGLALTHQIVSPFKSMTVLQNVMFAAGYKKVRNIGLSILNFSRSSEKKDAMAFLEMVDIAQYKNFPVSTMPLGILKRLEVARALAIKPKILLLDEPLAGLNSQEASRLADTIKLISQNGMTTVMIEHNLSEVLRISDRLYVLDNGKYLASGNPKEVMKQPEVRTAYLGS
ncbi:ABC transporter ATP-binding protein [Desulforhopalus singaporensis]|uniref:Amino acid/amide ABC transporter ATP-binding protein 1, HAAT family (TC 3.A.1.4.-) n=1 Tax=Desulforhopalus singaporensis TaxID=91360 RepID=A0A1H0UDL4_9BACT|nr:ABC transporter ATP-binding protein [Desulforhopalus singaporensis]SDP64392.1 amino acid/amide ABC transporter ATP-binding protein 1, HAAT family (TC 3.A.1.4.-) [Desulforhopalus singaporensis]